MKFLARGHRSTFVAAFVVLPSSTQLLCADPTLDCFSVPQTLCLQSQGKTFVVGPDHALPDLAIWYRFDKNMPVDESGQGHHLLDENQTLSAVAVGPGMLGRGSSASFDGRSFRVVPPSVSLERPSFSIALWLYLREDSLGAWRTIFRKGADPEELLPALLLWPDERRLQVRMSKRADAGGGMVLNSAGLLPLRRWTHVTVSCTDGSLLRLYINGAKDSEAVAEGRLEVSRGELHLGRDPWRAGTRAFIDDFRWYTRPLEPEELRALLFPSLTGAAAGLVHLGCMACGLGLAERSCSGGRSHLCSLQELLSGGLQLARAAGWLAASPDVWYSGEDVRPAEADKRLGLCCAD